MAKRKVGDDGRVHYAVADHVRVWVGEGGGSVHIKTSDPYGDPVELGEGEVEDLIQSLNALLNEIR